MHYQEKLFECRWGDGYVTPTIERISTHGLNFFAEENGFDAELIEKVRSLRVHDTLDATDLSGELYIKRIQ